jgi:hypothetical protein
MSQFAVSNTATPPAISAMIPPANRNTLVEQPNAISRPKIIRAFSMIALFTMTRTAALPPFIIIPLMRIAA